MSDVVWSGTFSAFFRTLEINMLRILLVDPDAPVSRVLSEALNQEFGADVTLPPAARWQAAPCAGRHGISW